MSVMSISAASAMSTVSAKQVPLDDALTLGATTRFSWDPRHPSALQGTLPVGMCSVLAGLAVVSVLFASVLTGVCIALYTRSHWSDMTERARRFIPSKDRPSDQVGLLARGLRRNARRVDRR
jgi:hypothetical protein